MIKKTVQPSIIEFLTEVSRGLGLISIYGKDHPSIQLMVDQVFDLLSPLLKEKTSISLSATEFAFRVDDTPVSTRNAAIQGLKKRFLALNISILRLSEGMKKEELAELLFSLAATSNDLFRKNLSDSTLSHVKSEDVKYVPLREGEQIAGKDQKVMDKTEDDSETVSLPQAQVHQILAFLKGNEPTQKASEKPIPAELKETLNNPEALGRLILESATVRQGSLNLERGETLGDIVIGCLRKTYTGLRSENEFKTITGKVKLSKAMLLLEKNVMDKIHASMGEAHPEVDDRILKAVRDMEAEQQFDILSARYISHHQKATQSEEKIIEAIQKYGARTAQEKLSGVPVPAEEWNRMIVQAETSGESAQNQAGSTFDMSSLAIVLERLSEIMELDQTQAKDVKAAATETRKGLRAHVDGVTSKLKDLETQVLFGSKTQPTMDNHVQKMNRSQILTKMSELALDLTQPVSVINASLEAAQKSSDPTAQSELIDLAVSCGVQMEKQIKRLRYLVGYPALKNGEPLS